MFLQQDLIMYEQVQCPMYSMFGTGAQRSNDRKITVRDNTDIATPQGLLNSCSRGDTVYSRMDVDRVSTLFSFFPSLPSASATLPSIWADTTLGVSHQLPL